MNYKNYTILLLMISLVVAAPAMSALPQHNYSCNIFYDASASRDGSVQVALNFITDISDNQIEINMIPVHDASDLLLESDQDTSAMLIFHGSENGLVIGDSNSRTLLVTWNELALFIDSSNYGEYFILGCNSAQVDELVSKEHVLTFSGAIDAKIAAAITMLKISQIVESFDADISNMFMEKITIQIEDDDFVSRFYEPIDPLLDFNRDDHSVLHGLILPLLKDFRGAVREHADLVDSYSTYDDIFDDYELICNLVTFGLYDILGDIGTVGAEVLDDLNAIFQDFINGDISSSTLMATIKLVLDAFDFILLVRSYITGVSSLSDTTWKMCAEFMIGAIVTVFSIKAQYEDYDNNDYVNGLVADNVAELLDEEKHPSANNVGTGVYEALDGLIIALESEINLSDIKTKAGTLSSSCGRVITQSLFLGGSLKDYTVMLVSGIRDMADSIEDSGAEYIDKYPVDNWSYEYSFSIERHIFDGDIEIKYTLKNPDNNQIPFYKLYTSFTEEKHGASRSNYDYFNHYLLPGDSFSVSFRLNYNVLDGYRVVWDYSVYAQLNADFYGDFTTNPDNDGDGISDYDEISHSNGYVTEPLDSDSDFDTLSDYIEIYVIGSNPNYPGLEIFYDFDNDGLSNGYEVNFSDTLVDVADTDNDGLSDGLEVNTWHTNPLDSDSDNDGLSDGSEVNTWHTDPLDSDSDNDGLSDGSEVNTWHTDPLDSDSDNDGYSDYYEVTYGYNPNDSGSHPVPVRPPKEGLVP